MWIDILFNDQNAISIEAELQQAALIYLITNYHLVIATSSVLTRAWTVWCLFEIVTRLKSGRQKVNIVHNWSKGPASFAHVLSVFDSIQASDVEDKTLIQARILSSFGIKEGFQAAIDKIVSQSSDYLKQGGSKACSILSFSFSGLFYILFHPQFFF